MNKVASFSAKSLHLSKQKLWIITGMFLDDSKIVIIHFLGEKVINGSRLFCAKNVRKINNKNFHRRLARAHVQYSRILWLTPRRNKLRNICTEIVTETSCDQATFLGPQNVTLPVKGLNFAGSDSPKKLPA